ncbi:MAG: ATP synthase subunit delta [Planctomycetota bacterium]|nr:MAG: ATP synthase subunit delta [Planctomycetota bacterium]
MASSTLILRRYAVALHALAQEAGIVEAVEAELADLDAVFSQSADLRDQMANPRLSATTKKAVLLQLLGAANTDVLRRTVLLMADKGRAALVGELHAAFQTVSMEASGRAVADVVSAAPLDDAARGQLIARLSDLTKRDISLSESVDPDLLGGLRVTIGSKMIDGSLKRRLETIQDSLLNAPLAG